MKFTSTEQALEYGKSIRGNRKKICNLKRHMKKFEMELNKLPEDDLNGRIKIATFRQLLRESLEEALQCETVCQ